MSSINAGNIAKGIFIIYKDAPHVVTKAEFMTPGKGTTVMRTRLKNVRTGVTSDFTFKASESVEVVEVENIEMQYLYRDAQELVFMDPRTYDQITIPVSLLEEQIGYLIADLKCWVLMYEDKPIGITLPPQVSLKVTEAPDSTAGNRVNAPKKPIKLETGIEIQAPIFIKEGENILVDTTTGEYVGRDTK